MTLRLPIIALLTIPLAISSCGRDTVKTAPIRPAATPAAAAATSFSAKLTEFSGPAEGVIATGTITTDAPLATATGGRFNLSPHSGGAVSGPGEAIVASLREHSSGPVLIHRSGNLVILQLRTQAGDPLLKIIGPPHGNSLITNWFYEGSDSGAATVKPK